MTYISKRHITNGVTWVAIKDAEVFICCGCPADTVKHLKKAGLIKSLEKDGIRYENGPNAILLSDTLIQNGQIANLTEFPILQMLYLQGYNLPNHPNYKKSKPILIGYKEQIQMQLDYVAVGNHGLSSLEEIEGVGISHENARKIFATKLHYSGGQMELMQDIITSCVLSDAEIEIKNGVFIQRLGINKFQIRYKDERVRVDLNLKINEHFSMSYKLPFKEIIPEYFSVTHTGEGNGWDENRPCMASVIHFNDKFYLIDAGPNVLENLSHLGIGLSEIDGVFLSHIHDDHFAGITELLNVERRLNFYTTKLVRKTAELKLKALMNSDVDLIHLAFNCIDLEYDVWRDINGLEVKPFYSPHTVETSAFNFRVKDKEKYKTYSHLSDTINLTEFKVITKESPDLFTSEDFSIVEDNYLTTVNLKKIDVGGGAIHGHLSDYIHDKSDILVMAHTTNALEPAGKRFINVSFGDTHTLIEDKSSLYLKEKCKTFLRRYFHTLEDQQIELLAETPIESYDPGETVASQTGSKKLKLIISGIVTYTDESGMDHMIDAGNFIGFSKRYFRHKLPEQYIAWSYVKCLELDEKYLNQFVLKYSLIDDLNKRINIIRLLRESDLIHNSISMSIYNRFSKYAEIVSGHNYNFSKKNLTDFLFIITKGTVRVFFDKKSQISIGEHNYFGGLDLLHEQRRGQRFEIADDVEAISIPVEKINNVPKILWKLMELDEKRFQLSIFKNK